MPLPMIPGSGRYHACYSSSWIQGMSSEHRDSCEAGEGLRGRIDFLSVSVPEQSHAPGYQRNPRLASNSDCLILP